MFDINHASPGHTTTAENEVGGVHMDTQEWTIAGGTGSDWADIQLRCGLGLPLIELKALHHPS